MKRLVTFLAISILFISFSEAQDAITTREKIQNQFSLPQIQKMVKEASMLKQEVRFCQEYFTWDDLSGEFAYSGEATMVIDIDSPIKTLTIELTTIQDGDVQELRLVNYWTFQEIAFNQDLQGDSTHIFIGDGLGNFQLFSRTINHFNGDQLFLTEDYFDYTLFGLPIGMVLSELVRYGYDNNNYLISKATDAFDFNAFSLVFSDSIRYTNNGIGLPIEQFEYTANFLSGAVELNSKTDYTYTASNLLESELYYFYDVDKWVKSDRDSYTYDGFSRLLTEFTEGTIDDGLSWTPYDRSQYDYQSNLAFGIYDSQIIQEYIDDVWVNSELNTYEDCTSGLSNLSKIEFDAWMNGNKLQFNLPDANLGGNVQVYDLSGKQIFNNNYQIIPDAIELADLATGIYIVNLSNNQFSGVRKFFKN